MIRLKKARKSDLPLLITYELQTITPYLKKDQEKLMAIATTNDFVSKNYPSFTMIYHFLNPIGMYLQKEKSLENLYVKKEVQNEKTMKKIIQKIKPEIEQIKLRKERTEEISFLQKWGFSKVKEEQEIVNLKKEG